MIKPGLIKNVSSSRIAGLDLIRVIAIFLVIARHFITLNRDCRKKNKTL